MTICQQEEKKENVNTELDKAKYLQKAQVVLSARKGIKRQ